MNKRIDRIEDSLTAMAVELARMNTILEKMQKQSPSEKLKKAQDDLFAEMIEGYKVTEMTEDEEE